MLLLFMEGELHKSSFVNYQLENVVKNDKMVLIDISMVQVQCKVKDRRGSQGLNLRVS